MAAPHDQPMESLDPAIALLFDLVNTPSPSGDERRASELLVQWMQRLGFDHAWVDPVNNSIAIRGNPQIQSAHDLRSLASSNNRLIVLLGHIDTFPGILPVRIEDGILYGRGSVDAKGPLAAFTVAAATAQLPPGVTVVVIGAVEEEAATSKGARHIVDQLQPDWCIIGEPSGWDAVTLGYKGRLLLEYTVEQDEAHSAGPHATTAEQVVQWWNWIDRYARQYNETRARLFDQILPSLRKINTQSDGLRERTTAHGGLRLPPNYSIGDFKVSLQEQSTHGHLRCYGYEPAIESGRNNLLVSKFSAAIRSLRSAPRYKLKTGTSDMNVVGTIWQCPIVAYGPGDSSLDHTPREHLHLDEYTRAIEVLRHVIDSSA